MGAKMRVGVKAAWITGAFVLLGALATGIFYLLKTDSPGVTNEQTINVDSGGRAAGRDYNETKIYGDTLRLTGKPNMDTRSGALGAQGQQQLLILHSMNNGGRKLDNLVLRVYIWAQSSKFLWTEPYLVDRGRVILAKDTVNSIHAFFPHEASMYDFAGAFIVTVFKFRDVDDNDYDSTISFGKMLVLGKESQYFTLSDDERTDLIKKLKRPGITKKSPFRFPL
jgi:hypothetical protein